MCLFNVAGLATTGEDVTANDAVGWWITSSILTVIAFVALWFYWNGHNWARILVLLTSLLALASLYFFAESSPVERVMLVAEAALAVFLLYWLNTKPVKMYFKP